MRKEVYVTIAGSADNRDNGKRFLIVEMSAYDLEWFYARALMALGTSGITVPQELADAGAIGLALLGYQVFMGASPAAIEPLKDEMMARCVRFAPDGDIRMGWNPQLVEEVSTLRSLREKWLELHTGFTLAELARNLKEAVSAKMAAQASLSPNTSTSPASSEPSFPSNSPRSTRPKRSTGSRTATTS